MTELPRANWPDSPEPFKVVQMYIEGEPYLRFGTFPEEYHKSIIKKTGSSLNRECPTVEKGYSRLPSLEADWYKVVGMGKAIVSVAEKKAEFYERSRDYNIVIDQKHLDDMKPFFPDWEIKNTSD